MERVVGRLVNMNVSSPCRADGEGYLIRLALNSDEAWPHTRDDGAGNVHIVITLPFVLMSG